MAEAVADGTGCEMMRLSGLEVSVLARIAANPQRAAADKNALLKKLSPIGRQVAHAILGDSSTSLSVEVQKAARAVRRWTARQRKARKYCNAKN